MKKLLLIVSICVFFTLSGLAQMKEPAARVQGLKIAFITRQLNLSAEEAQKFWPVYYDYSDELMKARREQQEDVLAFEEQALGIRKRYKNEFKKILLSDERVNKTLTAERDFNNMLKRELQQRMEMRRLKKGGG